MSLAIDVRLVAGVLLADGWHVVLDHSFDLDAYEFEWEKGVLAHPGGNGGVCATGFTFKTVGRRMFGPLTAILAVSYE